MEGDDKRAARRVPVVLRIKLHYKKVDTFISKFATNISSGGMFITSRKPKPVGTEIRFELRLADESPLITGIGVVRWVRDYDPQNPKRPHGMGIEFGDVGGDSRELIDKIIEHKRAMGVEDTATIPYTRRRTARSDGAVSGGVRGGIPETMTDLPPREHRPARPSVEALIAQATAAGNGNGESWSDARLRELIDADMPSLDAALTRARELARGVDERELVELARPAAAAMPESIDAASRALAAMVGGHAVSARRARKPRVVTQQMTAADLAPPPEQPEPLVLPPPPQQPVPLPPPPAVLARASSSFDIDVVDDEDDAGGAGFDDVAARAQAAIESALAAADSLDAELDERFALLGDPAEIDPVTSTDLDPPLPIDPGTAFSPDESTAVSPPAPGFALDAAVAHDADADADADADDAIPIDIDDLIEDDDALAVAPPPPPEPPRRRRSSIRAPSIDAALRALEDEPGDDDDFDGRN